MEIFKDATKYLSMLPLVGKLVGKASRARSKYKPENLNDLPIYDIGGGVGEVKKDTIKIFPGKRVRPHYTFDRSNPSLPGFGQRGSHGKDKEQHLKLPPADLNPGQLTSERTDKSMRTVVGRVGIKARPKREAAYLEQYNSPLLKYMKKSDQLEIRGMLQLWGTPAPPLDPEFTKKFHPDPVFKYGPGGTKIEIHPTPPIEGPDYFEDHGSLTKNDYRTKGQKKAHDEYWNDYRLEEVLKKKRRI